MYYYYYLSSQFGTKGHESDSQRNIVSLLVLEMDTLSDVVFNRSITLLHLAVATHV